MTYTPCPGMVPVSLPLCLSTCVSASAIRCTTPQPDCKLPSTATLSKPRITAAAAAAAAPSLSISLGLEVLDCLVDACRFQVLLFVPPRDNMLPCSHLSPGVAHGFTGSLCIDLHPGWATRVVSSRRTRNGSGRGRGSRAPTRRRAPTWPRATVVLARQILSRHDGLTD